MESKPKRATKKSTTEIPKTAILMPLLSKRLSMIFISPEK
jgi:hypothetical protein